MNLEQHLNWRYATKNMNGENVSSEKLNAILHNISLSASSYGLQPYRVLVVSNPEIKQKLQAAALNQPQVGSSSHVLVFTVPLSITQAMVDQKINQIATAKKIPVADLEGYKNLMGSKVLALKEEQQQTWSAKQAYVALGIALVAAAEQQVDACPMEGFDPAQVDTILGLSAKGLKSVVMLPIGYRSKDDTNSQFKKLRKTKEELFEFVA